RKHSIAAPRLHLARLIRRLVAQRVRAPARVLDQQHPLERLARIAEDDLDEMLDGAVDAADERNPVEQRLVERDEPFADQVRREHSGRDEDQEREDTRDDRVQPRDRQIEQRLGPVLRRHPEQEPLHEPEEQPENENRRADRCPDEQAGDDVAAKTSDGRAHATALLLLVSFLSFFSLLEEDESDFSLSFESLVARLRFFSLSDLKSVSYQPPPFRRNAGAEISRFNAGCSHSGQSRKGSSDSF